MALTAAPLMELTGPFVIQVLAGELGGSAVAGAAFADTTATTPRSDRARLSDRQPLLRRIVLARPAVVMFPRRFVPGRASQRRDPMFTRTCWPEAAAMRRLWQ